MPVVCRVLAFISIAMLLIFSTEVIASPSGFFSKHNPYSTISLQGVSGILNTPTGYVQEEGTLEALYNNQEDLFGQRRPASQDNYLFSVGFFNFAEIGGRLTEAEGIARDLSANAKLSTAPLTAQLPFAPALALGIQDMGGGSSFFRSTYLAVSADPLPWIRLSAGYGWGPDRMDGGFGGLELKAHDWISLLGEYDTEDTNLGIRLISPPLLNVPVRLTFATKTALNHSSNIDFAFGLTIPLDFKNARSARIQTQGADGAGVDEGETDLKPTSLPSVTQSASTQHHIAPPSQNISTRVSRENGASLSREAQLSSIHTRLVDAGFANVQVGVLKDRVLVIEYENVRYNHNELDAIGVVAGIASSAAIEGIDSLCMVVKRKGLRMLLVKSSFQGMKEWLAEPMTSRPPVLTVDSDTSAVADTSFIEVDNNSDWLRPSLILYPNVKTFVGTEAGVFDYLVSVRPELQVTAWKGAVLNARWDIPVAWSDNFDDNRIYSSSRNDPEMDRLMLFQGFHLAPDLIANLGAGMILPDTNGTLNELVWNQRAGTHRIRLAQAFAHDSEHDEDLNVWLGSYRMYILPLDLFIEGTAGRFWGQDTGGVVTLKRFFGDTAIDLYYKNTETRENRRWQVAGIQISFPLTPRRDMKRAPLQLRGNEEWGYSQETVLASNGQKSNDTVSAALGINPVPSASVHRSYLNRDRLNEAYINSHENRLKDAWHIFKNDLANAFPKL